MGLETDVVTNFGGDSFYNAVMLLPVEKKFRAVLSDMAEYDST